MYIGDQDQKKRDLFSKLLTEKSKSHKNIREVKLEKKKTWETRKLAPPHIQSSHKFIIREANKKLLLVLFLPLFNHFSFQFILLCSFMFVLIRDYVIGNNRIIKA